MPKTVPRNVGATEGRKPFRAKLVPGTENKGKCPGASGRQFPGAVQQAHVRFVCVRHHFCGTFASSDECLFCPRRRRGASPPRSEEHTSELQSLAYLVCRLLLEKKKERTKSQQCARGWCVMTLR